MNKFKFYLISLVLLIFSFLFAEFDYVTIPPGADPSVSAEDGGNGFDKIASSLGYQTHIFTQDEIKYFGSDKAVKGGTLHDVATRFPATMRLFGREANYLENYWIEILCYESLLEGHPLTADPVIPKLASHWKISDDKMQFWFRIDPEARWSDGAPVTSADVIATWDLLMDETILAPSEQITYGKFERPVAGRIYIVSVKAKSLDWMNLLNFAYHMTLHPAHYLNELDGTAYIEEYLFKMPGSDISFQYLHLIESTSSFQLEPILAL